MCGIYGRNTWFNLITIPSFLLKKIVVIMPSYHVVIFVHILPGVIMGVKRSIVH